MIKGICDRCGDNKKPKSFTFNFDGELVELRKTYQTLFVKKLCGACGEKADSFINYYGRKKKEDVRKLNNYLRSGELSKSVELKRYSQLTSAGYY